jgi:hypothetical protein
MLDTVSRTESPPQILPDARKSRVRKPKIMAIDAIQASIAPLGDEADLLNSLCGMAETNDTVGMIVLFDTFVTVAETYQNIANQPRATGEAEDLLDSESDRAWSKAYMVADFLKDQPISDIHRDEVGRVLVTCALAMGHGLKNAAEIAAELANLPDGFERSAEEMQPPTVLSPSAEDASELGKAAMEFEFIAAQLMGPMLDIDDPVTDALQTKLFESRDGLCEMRITSRREAAFMVMMANAEADGVANGINGHREKSERRLHTILYMIGDYLAEEIASWPGARQWNFTPSADPRSKNGRWA